MPTSHHTAGSSTTGRKRVYRKYTYKDRFQLIKMVLEENKAVAPSARELKIRQTTARLIISTYKTEKRIFERKEESQKRKKRQAKQKAKQLKEQQKALKKLAKTNESVKLQTVSSQIQEKIEQISICLPVEMPLINKNTENQNKIEDGVKIQTPEENVYQNYFPCVPSCYYMFPMMMPAWSYL